MGDLTDRHSLRYRDRAAFIEKLFKTARADFTDPCLRCVGICLNRWNNDDTIIVEGLL